MNESSHYANRDVHIGKQKQLYTYMALCIYQHFPIYQIGGWNKGLSYVLLAPWSSIGEL